MQVFGVGLIGCGNISGVYLHNIPKYRGLEVRGVADINPEAAKMQGEKFGVPPYGVAELLARDDVDIVLNLTIPEVHAEVSSQIIAAGKHAYSEKPLGVDFQEARALVAQANASGLRIGCAPDTFLGASGRLARQIIDDGKVGEILSGQITIMSHGHEHWHPNPGFFFQPGAGPVMDMGPYYLHALINLIGPVRRVRSVNSTGFSDRTATADGPNKGQQIKVNTPTTLQSILEFESGAQIIFAASWDVWKHGLSPIELYGSKGSLRVPDPNHFGGLVETAIGREDWEGHATTTSPLGELNWPIDRPDRANYRAAGIADMAASISEGRPHRADGNLSLHALEIMLAIVNAKPEDSPVTMTTRVPKPRAVSHAEARALFSA